MPVLNTLARQRRLLELIPEYPARITIKQLNEQLNEEGYRETKRTIERDLEELAKGYMLAVDKRSKPHGWSWDKGAKRLNVHSMSIGQALTFSLVEQHLAGIVPANLRDDIAPFLDHARDVLSAAHKNHARRWLNKVRVVPTNQPLLAPKVDADVLRTSHRALFDQEQIKITYRRAGEKQTRQYVLNPLAQIQRGGVYYLVASKKDSDDLQLFALHRMEKAETTSVPLRMPPGFNIDEALKNGLMGFGQPRTETLIVHLSNECAAHLYESPLDEHQSIEPIDENTVRLTARLPITPQLKWWLLGFGANAEVIAPAGLRVELAETAASLHCCYNGSTSPTHAALSLSDSSKRAATKDIE